MKSEVSPAAMRQVSSTATMPVLSKVSRVGGLVGNTTKGKTSFTNCYNAGKIIAPADSCGPIVGISVNNDKQWAEATL